MKVLDNVNLRESAKLVADDALALFRSTFAGEPDVIASAPARINLVGEHTDYNGGEVLPIAIARRTCLAMAKRENATKSRAVSSTEEDTGEFTVAHASRSGHSWDCISGLSAFASTPLPALDRGIGRSITGAAVVGVDRVLIPCVGLTGRRINGKFFDVRLVSGFEEATAEYLK